MSLSSLKIDYQRLSELCSRYHVEKMEVMGSFARNDEGPESDIDILVTFLPNCQIGLEFISLKQELEELTGRNVDLLTRDAVERSPNKYFKYYALQHTVSIYEQK